MTQHHDIGHIAIIEYGQKPADQFTVNPKNWRIHPESQREAVDASIKELGFLKPVIENRRTGYLIDGHERVWWANQHGNVDVPYVLVDLPEREEALALSLLDKITDMALTDKDKYAALISEIQQVDEDVLDEVGRTDAHAMDEIVRGMAESELGSFCVDEGELPELPDGEAPVIQQMTFTLHVDQVQTIKEALRTAQAEGEYGETGNENSNGNALARICEAYCG